MLLLSGWPAANAEQPPAEAEQAEDARAEPAQTPTFDVWEFQVEGNTLLERTEVERSVYHHLGENKTINDVEAARAGLEALYRSKGYATVLVNIPEQDVREGVVRLEVIEGKIERLRISGNKYFSRGKIREQLPALAAGQVPHLPTVQDQLQQVGQASPDRAVTPIFRAGRDPGTVEVELKVKDELPLHGDVELNNRYSNNTTHSRLSGSLSYDNLWQRQHSLSLSYLTTPEDTSEVSVLSGTYLMPIEDSDNLLVFYAVSSKSDVESLGTLGVIGDGIILGLRGILPLRGSRTLFHSLNLGLDYKDTEDTVRLDGGGDLITPLEFVKFSAEYRATFLGTRGSTRAGLGVHLAPRGWINLEDEFENKRFQAEPNFFYIKGSLEREQRFDKGYSLTAKLAGQAADGPLVSNEQFCVGGAESVRGYVECEELGDHAVSGMVELRFPSQAARIGAPLKSLVPLLFFEGASVHVEEPLPGESEQFTLLATGVGLRLSAWDGFKGEFDWAYPLRDASSTLSGDQRWHFRLGYEF